MFHTLAFVLFSLAITNLDAVRLGADRTGDRSKQYMGRGDARHDKATQRMWTTVNTRYDSVEHKAIGDAVHLKGLDKDAGAPIFKIGVGGGTPATFGDIIAIAGDFVAPTTTEGQVCEAHDESGKELRVNTIVGYFAGEGGEEAEEMANNDRLQRVMDMINVEKTKGFGAEATAALNKVDGCLPGSSCTAPKISVLGITRGSLWLDMVAVNYDHFMPCSRTAYAAFHKNACMAASKATTVDGLTEAYFRDAIGLHFATDMFAAGHLRTPQIQLIEEYCGTENSGGFNVNLMHNEDNTNGLFVLNQDRVDKKEDPFFIFGDYKYLDAGNGDARKISKQAAQASADEIYECYTSKTGDPSQLASKKSAERPGALYYTPDYDLTRKTLGIKKLYQMNTCPIFLFNPQQKGRMYHRHPWDKLWACDKDDVSHHKGIDIDRVDNIDRVLSDDIDHADYSEGGCTYVEMSPASAYDTWISDDNCYGAYNFKWEPPNAEYDSEYNGYVWSGFANNHATCCTGVPGRHEFNSTKPYKPDNWVDNNQERCDELKRSNDAAGKLCSKPVKNLCGILHENALLTTIRHRMGWTGCWFGTDVQESSSGKYCCPKNFVPDSKWRRG